MCEGELLAVTVLYRHGDRTPALFYPNDPHKNSPVWTAAPGDLTNFGKRRMYELGQWLRERYDGFISKTYKQDEIYVLSSDKDRCIVSAYVTLAGLYPLSDEQDNWQPDILWQPIPVHTIPTKYDQMLCYFETQQFIEHLSDLQKGNNEGFKDLFQYLSNHCGKKIENSIGAAYLWDTLDVEEKHNLILPDWTREVYPQILKSFRDRNICGLNNTQSFNKLSAQLFFNEVLEQFESYSSQHQTNAVHKMKMFSGHDINLHVMLQALDIPHSLDIPSGASIMLELRRSKFGQLFVQLIYKTDGIEVLEMKKNCTQCRYEDFVDMLKSITVNEKES